MNNQSFCLSEKYPRSLEAPLVQNSTWRGKSNASLYLNSLLEYALANEATNLTNILHTEQTPGAYKHMIKEYLHKQITSNQDTAKLSTWYNKTIVPGIHIVNNRIADVHIRRLHFWVHTKSFVGPNNKAL